MQVSDRFNKKELNVLECSQWNVYLRRWRTKIDADGSE